MFCACGVRCPPRTTQVYGGTGAEPGYGHGGGGGGRQPPSPRPRGTCRADANAGAAASCTEKNRGGSPSVPPEVRTSGRQHRPEDIQSRGDAQHHSLGSSCCRAGTDRRRCAGVLLPTLLLLLLPSLPLLLHPFVASVFRLLGRCAHEMKHLSAAPPPDSFLRRFRRRRLLHCLPRNQRGRKGRHGHRHRPPLWRSCPHHRHRHCYRRRCPSARPRRSSLHCGAHHEALKILRLDRHWKMVDPRG